MAPSTPVIRHPPQDQRKRKTLAPRKNPKFSKNSKNFPKKEDKKVGKEKIEVVYDYENTFSALLIGDLPYYGIHDHKRDDFAGCLKIEGNFKIIPAWVHCVATEDLTPKRRSELKKFIDNGKYRNLLVIYLCSDKATPAGNFIDEVRKCITKRGIEIGINYMPNNTTLKTLRDTHFNNHKKAVDFRTKHFSSFTNRQMWCFDPYPMFNDIFENLTTEDEPVDTFYNNFKLTLKARLKVVRPDRLFPKKEPEVVDFDPELAGPSTSPIVVSPPVKRKQPETDVEFQDAEPAASKPKVADPMSELASVLRLTMEQNQQHQDQLRSDIQKMAYTAYEIAGNSGGNIQADTVNLVDGVTNNLNQQHVDNKHVHLNGPPQQTPGNAFSMGLNNKNNGKYIEGHSLTRSGIKFGEKK